VVARRLLPRGRGAAWGPVVGGGRARRWSRGVCSHADAASRAVTWFGAGGRGGGRAASVATRTPRRVRSRGSARADAAVVARRPLPRGRGATCGQLGGSGGCIGGCAASVEARTRRWVLGAAARSGRGGRGSGCAASVGGLVALRAASVGGLVGGRAASVAWRSRCRGPPRCQRAAGASVAALRPLLRGLGAACGRGVGGGCARPQSRGACCVAESLRRAVKWLGGGGQVVGRRRTRRSSRGIRCRALVATSNHGGWGGRAPRWSRGVCCRAVSAVWRPSRWVGADASQARGFCFRTDAAPRAAEALRGGKRVRGRAASVAARSRRRVTSSRWGRASASVGARRPLPRGRGAAGGEVV